MKELSKSPATSWRVLGVASALAIAAVCSLIALQVTQQLLNQVQSRNHHDQNREGTTSRQNRLPGYYRCGRAPVGTWGNEVWCPAGSLSVSGQGCGDGVLGGVGVRYAAELLV